MSWWPDVRMRAVRHEHRGPAPSPDAFWAVPVSHVLEVLQTSPAGLSSGEAAARSHAAASVVHRRMPSALLLLLRQFRNPITLILIVATVLSAVLGDIVDASIILVIVLLSGLLSFWQEHTASRAVAELLASVQVAAAVLRDGQRQAIPTTAVVPGDIVLLETGSLVPADCLLLASDELLVNEASLTGESFPAEKRPGVVPEEALVAERDNCLFMGTFVVRGEASAVAVHTGAGTAFGKIAADLEGRSTETRFEQGLTSVGRLLLYTMLVVVTVVLIANSMLGRPLIDSLLFSLALAVGITPQLLPAIVSASLAVGARQMSRARVIVKRLDAIEDFGGMDVLCTDKTGTLTEGTTRLDRAVDPAGNESAAVLEAAYLNAYHQSGYANPTDDAILAATTLDVSDSRALAEAPYDFERRRLSVLIERGGSRVMLTKGAVEAVLAVCDTVADGEGSETPMREAEPRLRERFEALSAEGYRVLAMARKPWAGEGIDARDETGMVFIGFLLFSDPPKAGIEATLGKLASMGVEVRIVTGDNRFAARDIARRVGMDATCLLTGDVLRRLSGDDLVRQVADTTVFAEVDPAQKEVIVRALRKAGHDVGYLGDGINDALALHAADVGISVDTAAGVARESASIVLLEKDLGVLMDGVRLGRRVLANTMKYIFIAIAGNFGNMVSMAIATLALPFLPLLPFQILLINLLTDLPGMTIATDRVDSEQVERAGVWDVGMIRRFMVVFGLVSTVFDLLTFGVLRGLFGADAMAFRSGWFLVSVATEIVVTLVLRTHRPFFRSVPSRMLLGSSALLGALALVIPFTPLGELIQVEPPSWSVSLALAGVLAGYILATEIAKNSFYRQPAAEQ